MSLEWCNDRRPEITNEALDQINTRKLLCYNELIIASQEKNI